MLGSRRTWGNDGVFVTRRVKDQRLRHLKAWREVSGFSQSEVEKFFGWSQPKVSNLECGRQHITDEIRDKLAGLYGCAPEELWQPPPIDRVQSGVITARVSRQRANGLATALEIISELLQEHQAIKADLAGQLKSLRARIDKNERQLRLAAQAISDSARGTVELASMFDRSAAMLRTASQLPPLEPEPFRAPPTARQRG